MKVSGEVYSVRERLAETHPDGEEGVGEISPTWYEYEVYLLGEEGEIISSWNSLHETYNGVQQLTEEDCLEGIEEIRRDIEEEKVDSSHWFPG